MANPAPWMREAAERILQYSDATNADLDKDDVENIADIIARHAPTWQSLYVNAEAYNNHVRELVEAAYAAERQIDYLHEKFTATGTGNAVVARLRRALEPFKEVSRG